MGEAGEESDGQMSARRITSNVDVFWRVASCFEEIFQCADSLGDLEWVAGFRCKTFDEMSVRKAFCLVNW